MNFWGVDRPKDEAGLWLPDKHCCYIGSSMFDPAAVGWHVCTIFWFHFASLVGYCFGIPVHVNGTVILSRTRLRDCNVFVPIVSSDLYCSSMVHMVQILCETRTDMTEQTGYLSKPPARNWEGTTVDLNINEAVFSKPCTQGTQRHPELSVIQPTWAYLRLLPAMLLWDPSRSKWPITIYTTLFACDWKRGQTQYRSVLSISSI
jgi:hypothetical protein